jgi:predicted HTH transcriptional regulator
LTPPEVAASFHVSKQGAHKAIKALVDLGILREAGYRASNNAHRYVSQEVVDAASS